MKSARVLVAILAALEISLAQAIALESLPNDPNGIWSRAGRTFAPESQIRAPSGLFVLRETPRGLELADRRTTILQEIVSAPPLTEILWGPDNHWFAINASDGGSVGTWSAFVYHIDTDDRPTVVSLRDVLNARLRSFARCSPEEPANLGVASWLNSGREILAIAEVPPHSSCQNLGAIKGYRIAVNGWIIEQEISEANLRQTWSAYLGPRFAQSAR